MIRDINQNDQSALWALNQANTPHVSSLTETEFAELCQLAEYKKVFVYDEKPLGFLIGFLPKSSYNSVNYQWFEQHYPVHAYIDRINVSEHARGQGVASKLYDDFADFAKNHQIDALSCEVNIRPRNETSLAFHAAIGFKEVGTQEINQGEKEVAMLLKKL